MGVIESARAALQERLTAFVKCATGTVSLSCSGDSFFRTTGSFITDGFRPGDEILPSGFNVAVDVRHTVKDVAALTLRVRSSGIPALSASARSITSPVPEGRAREGFKFIPTPGRPWIRDRMVPQLRELRTLSSKGRVENQGTWFVDLFYPSGIGSAGIDSFGDVFETHFYPSLQLARDGFFFQVITASRSGGQIESEWIMLPLTVRFRVSTFNP